MTADKYRIKVDRIRWPSERTAGFTVEYDSYEEFVAAASVLGRLFVLSGSWEKAMEHAKLEIEKLAETTKPPGEI